MKTIDNIGYIRYIVGLLQKINYYFRRGSCISVNVPGLTTGFLLRRDVGYIQELEGRQIEGATLFWDEYITSHVEYATWPQTHTALWLSLT